MITVSKEDYLKAILEAEGEGEQVISARLAQWLSVSAPAVTMALRRLKRDGLVSVRERRTRPTHRGRAKDRAPAGDSASPDRAHAARESSAWSGTRCTTKPSAWSMPSPATSRPCSRASWAAEGLVRTAIRPTPESPRTKRKRGLLLLSESQPGGRYAVQSVYERDRRLGEFLEKLGIRPGAELTVQPPKLRRHAHPDYLGRQGVAGPQRRRKSLGRPGR